MEFDIYVCVVIHLIYFGFLYLIEKTSFGEDMCITIVASPTFKKDLFKESQWILKTIAMPWFFLAHPTCDKTLTCKLITEINSNNRMIQL